MTKAGGAFFSIPKRVPVVLEDRILYWMRGSYDSSIRCVTVLDGRVDAALMARAVRLTLDAEPVLGCRFVMGAFRQYWERMENPDEATLFEVLETSEYDNDIGAFLGSLPFMDLYKGPQVRAWLLRSAKDTLVINIQHVACDGVGAKDYLALLASIYSNLLSDPAYRPEPNVTRSRSMSEVLKNLSPADYFPIMRRGIRDFYQFMFPLVRKTPPSMHMPFSKGAMIVRTISGDLFRKFREYGHRHKATVNDMLLTAFLRAFYKSERPGEDLHPRVVGTVDMRRYLPDKKAVAACCNLSSFTYLGLGRGLGASFEDTLSRVSSRMTALKKDFIGFGPVPLSALLFSILPFSAALRVHDRLGDLQKTQASSGRDIAPLFSNMGIIDPERLVFGGAKVTAACVTTPVATPPVLAIGLTGFGESVTIAAGFCETIVTKMEVKRILDDMEKELKKL